MFRRVGSADSPLNKLHLESSRTPNSPGILITNTDSTSISSPKRRDNERQERQEDKKTRHRRQRSMSSFNKTWATMRGYMNSTRLVVLLVLCLQNSMFTTLRRYSQGVLNENYSKVRKRALIAMIQYNTIHCAM